MLWAYHLVKVLGVGERDHGSSENLSDRSYATLGSLMGDVLARSTVQRMRSTLSGVHWFSKKKEKHGHWFSASLNRLLV